MSQTFEKIVILGAGCFIIFLFVYGSWFGVKAENRQRLALRRCRAYGYNSSLLKNNTENQTMCCNNEGCVYINNWIEVTDKNFNNKPMIRSLDYRVVT